MCSTISTVKKNSPKNCAKAGLPPLRDNILLFVLFLLSLQCIYCSNDSSDDDAVAKLTLSNGQVSTTLNAGSSGDFIILPFSAPSSTSVSGSAAYTLQLTAESSAKLSAELPDVSAKQTSSHDPVLLNRMQQRAEFEGIRQQHLLQTLQQFQAEAKQVGGYDIKGMYKGTPPLLSKPSFVFASTITIFSPFAGDNQQSIQGTLLASDANAAIYLDTRDSGSFSITSATAVLQTFAQISIPRVRAFTGNESDINGDGGVVVFVSSATPDFALAFVRPLDLLPDGVDPLTKSNEMEIIYTALPVGEPTDALYHATLAHEFFHLVNIAVKSLPVFVSSGGTQIPLEETGISEGMAHLIEDLVGWGGGDTFAVAGQFLDNANLASVNGSVDDSIKSSSDDTLARRGAAMLLLRYLFEQAGSATYSTTSAGDISGGGVQFFRALNSSSLVGLPNVESAAGTSMAEIFGNWVAALYLDGTGLSSNALYNYQAEVTDSFTNGPRGFNLRGSRTLSSGSTVTLTGPALQQTLLASGTTPLQTNSTLFLSGVNFLQYRLSGSTTAELVYQTTADSSPGLTIITLP